MIDVAILNGHGRPLSSLSRQEMLSHLADRGVVVLRGFATDVNSFEDLTRSFGERFSCDPSKKRLRAGSDTRTVPTNGYGLNPHNENTFIPGACPDLVWFHCVEPAEKGGRSLLCDGTDLWAELSEPTKHLFTTQRLRYQRTFPRRDWRAVYGVETTRQLRSILDGIGVKYEISPLRALAYDYLAPQTQPTLFQGDIALHTNLLSRRPFWGVGESEPDSFEDGTPVPRDVVEEVLRVAREQTIRFPLRAGDLALIDNSRVLHGRGPFEGARRNILVRCSWLDQAARELARTMTSSTSPQD